MSRVQFRRFGGIMPKVSSRNLPDMAAQTAENCWLAETDLSPITAPSTIEALLSASYKSIYKWYRGGSSEWLSWLDDVNVCQGPIADDQYDRIYYTDGTTLHMKLWDGAAKVEVDDVSATAPSAPTIAKGVLFDPSGITMYWRDSYSGYRIAYNLVYQGYTWKEGLLELKFHQNATDFQHVGTNYFTTGVYHITLPSGYDYSDSGITPHDSMEADQAALFVDTIDITKTGESTPFAEFQVVNLTVEEDRNDAHVFVNGFTLYGKTVTVLVNMNYARSATQYQYYVLTTVDSYGQESPPSDVSEQVEWGPNDTLTISGTGRLYRSATGSEESDFYFVADITGSYVDNKTDSELAEVIPLIENPPSAMSGLVSMPGGFLAAFSGKDIYFSEPWLPYSWPTRYRITIDFAIVGLAVSGNDLIVLTEGNPYFVSGSHPEIMTQTKMPVEQSCVAKRSIAFADRYVLYASPDGLVSISGGQVQVISSSLYTRDQWNDLSPEDFVASVHDNRYIAFHAGGGIIFDFQDQIGSLTTTDETATGCYCDLIDDSLYLIQGSNITKWRGSSTNLTATWRSKMFQAVHTPLWSSAIVFASAYTGTTLRLYSDGVLRWTYTVTSNRAFRIPVAPRTEMWELELETVDTIYEVVIATSMVELRIPNPEHPLR